VLALGGGAFTIEQNRDLLKQNGVTVWLDCPLEMAARRVAAASHRPLARDPRQFAALYEARRQFYAMADIRIEIDCDDPDKVVEAILSHPELR
jgi:shikimate kinase